ncbi:response regulator containing a CheY-like receiver domain and an HTH DNA-binding domain [Mycolicibacterium chubuense NBB4]|uniref:Response regulator containing a CheY-like receiver domain and an HTH DNA-binding domain n=1 Tax=Mycolicibacterium chubuense (strain NBB4) TaxID=710421 RepID=I4BCW0_MYCCN|nr:LuxR family transcriptional regulator [Mycolicibacterium chubuense]AFM15117.1 response regulator containing a CheY-like receiver domain and an HTH DNA-binding domain [Mycolicibacterium chubuense NBB4]
MTGDATFVGRVREIDELTRRCTAAASDGIGVLTVTGRPGVGKTALLRQVATRCPAVRWATATAWESALAGGVVTQLLAAPAPAEPVAAAAAMAEAFAGDEPALIVVDDAQHADLASLQALSTLTRRHRTLPLLVVLLTDGSAPAVPGLGTEQLRLTGLSRAEVAELASARGRILHPAMAERLTRHTEGNPRHVRALLDEVPSDAWARPDSRLPAPHAVAQHVATLLEHAGPAGRALVVALAVLDDHRTLADAARLAGIDDPLAALESAVRAGLLSPGDVVEPHWADSLTAAAVIDVAGPRVTADLHRRAADIVADPAARLRHRVAATPVPDAALADEVDALARSRGTEGAWAQAAALFRDASRLTADPLLHDERLTRSVDALVAAGDCVGAAALVPAVESLRETPLRNAVLAYLAILRGRATEAELRLQRAWDIVNADRDPGTAAFIAQRHVLHALVQCQGEQLVQWADRALGLAEPGSPAAVEAAAIRGLGLLAAGQPKRASAAYDELSERVRHGAQAQRVVMGRGWVQLVRDDVDAARTNLESAVASAALGGSTRITLWAYGWLARVQFATGEWDDALTSVAHGRALAEASGIVLVTPLLEWTAGQIAALRGDWDAAADAAQAASAGPGEYAMMRIPTVLLKAHIAEAQADYGAVRRIVEPLRRIAPGTSLQEPGYWPWPDLLANALVLDGDLAGADEFLRPHEQRARARGHRSAQARLGYARGRLLGAQGDIIGARRSFDDALAHLEGLPLRYDAARVNFAYGQTLRRAGKRRAADAAISAARELYASLGATAYVARCDRELKAGGLNQLRDTRDGIELTPQEEAVSTLVAKGLSNREVAAELYVSPKTVQYHLTRIYAKLGVRSRSELAALRR